MPPVWRPRCSLHSAADFGAAFARGDTTICAGATLSNSFVNVRWHRTVLCRGSVRRFLINLYQLAVVWAASVLLLVFPPGVVPHHFHLVRVRPRPFHFRG